jgi:anti-anti-sigma regulatory factor
VARPDLSTVDHLCRIAFHARRLGVRLRLRGVSPELHELLDLAGVCDVCGCPDLPRVARGETNRG